MIFQRATSRCCYGWERSTIVKSFQIDAALEVWRSGPCRRRSGWGVRRGICRVDHEGSPLWNFWNLASLKRLMAFPRFLIIKPELAKPKYLKIKALFRETSLICRVRLQVCRVTLPLRGVTHNPSPRVCWILFHRHWNQIWIELVTVCRSNDKLSKKYIKNYFSCSF